MLHLTTKMEVNLLGDFDASDMNQLSTFIIKNKVPAVVVEPVYVENAIIDRNKYSPAYKIICAIDFEKGKSFALDKMYEIPTSALLADGFEIRVTHGRSDKESLNELRCISEFIHQRIDPTKEIRWALAMRTVDREKYDNTLRHMRQWRGSYIRTDINLLSPFSSLEAHQEDISFIRDRVPFPIKISGEVDYSTMMLFKDRVARYDVTLTQARRILNEALRAEQQRQEVVYAEYDEEEPE